MESSAPDTPPNGGGAERSGGDNQADGGITINSCPYQGAPTNPLKVSPQRPKAWLKA